MVVRNRRSPQNELYLDVLAAAKYLRQRGKRPLP